MTGYLDTNNPIHAKAILRAASHFLSSWDQSWDAEKLSLVIIEENHPEQDKVLIWDAIQRAAGNEDPYWYVQELIFDLAESFVDFLEENR
jgi:hypothetical protein